MPINQENKQPTLMMQRILASFLTSCILGNVGSRANPNATIVTSLAILLRIATAAMFYVCNARIVESIENVWYVANGCSNYMTGRDDLLVDIDISMTAKVETGTCKLVDVT